jgi:hypothetical protein
MNLLIGCFRQEGAKIACRFEEKAMKPWLYESNGEGLIIT